MKLVNVRKGHATNSSSSHSLLVVDRDLNKLEYKPHMVEELLKELLEWYSQDGKIILPTGGEFGGFYREDAEFYYDPVYKLSFLLGSTDIDIHQLFPEWKDYEIELEDDISVNSIIIRLPKCYGTEEIDYTLSRYLVIVYLFNRQVQIWSGSDEAYMAHPIDYFETYKVGEIEDYNSYEEWEQMVQEEANYDEINLMTLMANYVRDMQ